MIASDDREGGLDGKADSDDQYGGGDDRTALGHLFTDANRVTHLTSGQEESLWRRWREEGHLPSRGRLICSHISLVMKIANEMPSALPVEDRIRAGLEAMVNAFPTFDPTKGRFATHIYPWVKRAILDESCEVVPAVHLGEPKDRKLFFDKSEEGEQFRRETGRASWDGFVKDARGKFRPIHEIVRDPHRLNPEEIMVAVEEIAERLAAVSEPPEKFPVADDLRARHALAVVSLTPRQRRVLEARDQPRPITLEELGKEFMSRKGEPLSSQRVATIEREARERIEAVTRVKPCLVQNPFITDFVIIWSRAVKKLRFCVPRAGKPREPAYFKLKRLKFWVLRPRPDRGFRRGRGR
jgi:RNA polymerase sigma-32 factor